MIWKSQKSDLIIDTELCLGIQISFNFSLYSFLKYIKQINMSLHE
jgi:hypothetical protein